MKSRYVYALTWMLAVLFVAGAVVGAGDMPAQEVEEDNSLVSDLVTPHTPWGRGYSRGPLRVLFFLYSGPYEGTWEDTGTRVREAVEMMQRFDLQADAALFCGRGETWVFHGLGQGEARAERLLENTYDLYVIGGFPMERLPAKMQYLILRQVAQGAGLLVVGQGAQEYMTAQRQITPLPESLVGGLPVMAEKPANEYMSAYRLGNGRGVWLNYTRPNTLTPWEAFSWQGLISYDYWMMLTGRAALWAAGKETGINITSVGGDEPLSVSRSAPGSAEISLANDTQTPQALNVELQLRRAADGLVTPLETQTVELAAGAVATRAVPLPMVRAGEYYIDAVVRGRRGVEAFGAGNIAVESDYGVAQVEMDQSFVERGRTIRGTASLRGTPPAGSVVRVDFRNSYDRIVARQDFPVVAQTTDYEFAWRPDDHATIQIRVQAALVANGEEVEVQETAFTVPKRRVGQFNFVMWDMAQDVLGYYAQRKQQEANYDICLLGTMGAQPRAPSQVLQATDASIVPYSTRILDPKDEQGYMQPVCWNDEPAVDEYVQRIVDNQQNMREHGVFTYSLGDEGVTKGCCVHPACIAAYRNWLKDQYGTIERLNESWNEQYASFDEVNILDPADNMELQSRNTNPPRWFDREAFARYNLMQFADRFKQAYLELDPVSYCGFEGTGGFGDDFDAICGINTFYGPYPSIGDDIVRSIYPRERLRSNWIGYSKTGDALSDASWRVVMKGMDSVWYWMWSGIGSWRGYMRPTFDFWPAIEDLTEEMKPVREGLGDLLLNSEMIHSGIGVFYSLPSALSSQLGNTGSFVRPQNAHETMTRLTYELGLDFIYLTNETLQSGDLENRQIKVLVLPMTQAISAEETAIIRRFVQQGGTVIADVRPGIYNERCKPVMPGMMDDLFGIRRTGSGSPVETPVRLQTTYEGRPINVAIERAYVDEEIAAAGAEVLGTVNDIPVLLVNNVGSGQAILLNFQPVISTSDDPDAASMHRLLRVLYEVGGAQAAVTMTAPDGSGLPVTETRVWRNGEALVFGMWRQMENHWFSPKSGTIAGAPQPARIALSEPHYLYDLRAGKSLGRINRTDTRLRWGRPNFYMALPYEIRGIRVNLLPEAPAPEQPMRADISLAIPPRSQEKFAVFVEVIDPEGNSPLWGRQVVVVEQGRARVPLQVAHNDTPGQWTVRVREVFSGVEAEATYTVR